MEKCLLTSTVLVQKLNLYTADYGIHNDWLSLVYSGLRGNVFTTNSKRSFVFIPYFVHETCQY